MRSCEDVDEAALSYAEIKALCAGNPLIKERMDLEIEVSRLRLLKSEYQSQHYRLEDNLLKHFPESVERDKEYITGFESDLARLAEHTPKAPVNAEINISSDSPETTDKPKAGDKGSGGKGKPAEPFTPMVINGVTYTEKGKAGAALLEACKGVTTTEPVAIGSYKGFDMTVSFPNNTGIFTDTLHRVCNGHDNDDINPLPSKRL